MAKHGVEMEPAASPSAVKVGDTIKWPPGAVSRARHEGVGLSATWIKSAERRSVEILYDTAVGEGRFDPTVRDDLATRGLALPKSNWAQRLDTPPFVAYPVTGVSPSPSAACA